MVISSFKWYRSNIDRGCYYASSVGPSDGPREIFAVCQQNHEVFEKIVARKYILAPECTIPRLKVYLLLSEDPQTPFLR